MINERVSYLMTRFMERRITDAELHELSAILLENEDDEAFLSSVKLLIQNSASTETYDALAWEPVYRQVIDSAREAPVTKEAPVFYLLRRLLPYAAAVLLLGIGSWWWLNHTKTPATPPATIAVKQPDILPGGNKATLTLANGSQVVLDSVKGRLAQMGAQQASNDNGHLQYNAGAATVEYHTLSTPRGGQYQLTLPDGTVIWLNTASSIRYPTAFAGNERRVSVTGEAYFEVAHDKTKPFIVELPAVHSPHTEGAGGGEVKVLGTHFNINAYSDEAATKVTLLQGSVAVKRSGSGQLARLKPGEQAILGTDSPFTIDRSPDTEQALAWKNGLFDFNGASLPEVMRQLERWYDIQVKYEGQPPVVKWRGKMDRGVKFSDVLDILTRMEVKYKQQGRTLIILP